MASYAIVLTPRKLAFDASYRSAPVKLTLLLSLSCCYSLCRLLLRQEAKVQRP